MALYRRGKTWWFDFKYDGRRIQKSTEVRDRKEAEKIAKVAYTRLVEGKWGIVEQRPSLTVGELLDKIEADAKLRGTLSPQKVSSIKRVRDGFGRLKSDAVTAELVDRYIAKRKAAGAANATINRATELLRRAYRFAKLTPPEICHLSEVDNVRRGFFTPTEFAAVEQHLPEDLKDFCRFAFLTGWRKSEIASLAWSDTHEGVIRLRSENSKNGQGRSIVIAGELVALIERRKQARLANGVLTNLVFHREGELVAEFRKAWASACVSAGVGKWICPKCHGEGTERECPQCKVRGEYSGRIFHDFRRSAVRSMIRSGVPQSVAMKISGHKTASMFRRYDIASEDDLREAMLRIDRYNEENQQKVVSIAQ